MTAGATIGYAVTAALVRCNSWNRYNIISLDILKGIITGVKTDSTNSAIYIDVKIVE